MKKKILVVEDDTIVRENIGEILELANYEVEVAENGKIGVEKARNNDYDLIICDVMMPVMDGHEVLYLLSKNKSTASIPFIFLTAKVERGDIRKGMELGADDYLTKPFQEMELLNAIEARLKKNEVFKSEFEDNISGVNRFLTEARGLEELQHLSEARERRIFRKGDRIYSEGKHPVNLYFVDEGKVKVHKLNPDGKEFVTGLYNKGDFFGYSAILEDAVYSDYAVALEDCEIYEIPKDDFLSLLYKNREVSSRFIKMITKDVIEKEQRLINLAYDTVRMKTAQSLIQLHDKFGREGEVGLKMAISRDDLASIAGIATETLIRALSDFKDENLITTEGRKIVIVDPDGLKALKW